MYSLLKSAFLNIFRRKSRSVLTFFGISIGMALLIVLISFVDGINAEAQSTIGKMQGIIVSEDSAPDQVFSSLDISYENKLKKINGVREVVSEYFYFVTEVQDKPVGGSLFDKPYVYGVDPSKFSDSSYSAFIDKLEKGRALKSGDKGVVMISKDLSELYLKNIGDSIKIGNSKFDIIGIYDVKSSFPVNAFILSESDFKEKFDVPKDKVNSFYVVLENNVDSSKIVKNIEFSYPLLKAQGQQEMMAQINDLLLNLTIIAIFVSLISAIVAAIGIINTMLMSVMERTKEIGTLKAVGWTRKNIIIMVILESIFLGILGSFFGVLLGIGISKILSLIVGIDTIVTITLILQIFLFGIFMGLLGGIYPAIKASKLDPVEALRDE